MFIVSGVAFVANSFRFDRAVVLNTQP